MIPCRIVANSLPDSVLEQVLRVDEVSDGDPRWELLRWGNTRRTYKFTAREGEASWVVKWGCRHTSWEKIRDAFLGRDQATVEWEKTCLAQQLGVTELGFSLLAAPRLASGRINSLLVTEYLDNSENLLQFISRNFYNYSLVSEVLRNFGGVVSGVHSKGLLHRDFSLDNLMIRAGEPERILIIDWFKMEEVAKDDYEQHLADLVAPITDMIYIGLGEHRMLPFLEGYAQEAQWLRGRFDEVLQLGRDSRIRVMRRAYKNCDWRSRSIIRYRHNGYKVFLIKNRGSGIAEKAIDSGTLQPEISNRFTGGKDSKTLLHWRLANVLRSTGVGGHQLTAYAVRKGLLKKTEVLVSDEKPEGMRLDWVLSSGDRKLKRRMLMQAGVFMRRLHYLDVSFKQVTLKRWRCEPVQEVRMDFSTDDLDSLVPFNCKSFDEHFGWIKDASLRKMGLRALLWFMRGYGDGSVDRKILFNVFGLLNNKT